MPIEVAASSRLSAITMMPANDKWSSRLPGSFFINETITIVVVRLFRMVLRQKAAKPSIYIGVDNRVVLMREVTTSKPVGAPITFTMVIAQIRKAQFVESPSGTLTGPHSPDDRFS